MNENIKVNACIKWLVFVGLFGAGFFASGAYGQCGTTQLFTQADIDNFTELGCDGEIHGDLLIGLSFSDPIHDLDGLSSLNTVTGALTIFFNPELTDYCGLWNLIASDGLEGFYSNHNFVTAPTLVEIIEAGPCLVSLSEVLAILVEDGVLTKGQANSLSKQAEKSLRALGNHLSGLTKAGVLTEEEADLIFSAATL